MRSAWGHEVNSLQHADPLTPTLSPSGGEGANPHPVPSGHRPPPAPQGEVSGRRSLALLAAIAVATAAHAQTKPTLTPDQYGQWEVIKNLQASPDGRVVALELERFDGRKRMIWQRDDLNRPAIVDNGAQVQFSKDGQFMAFLVGQTGVVRHVTSGQAVTIEKAKSLSFSGEAAMVMSEGSMTLINLPSLNARSFPGTRGASFNPQSTKVVLFVQTPQGFEAQAVDVATGATTILYRGAEEEPIEVRWAADGGSGFLVTRQGAQVELRHFDLGSGTIRWFDRLQGFPRGYRAVAVRGFESDASATWIQFGITNQFPWGDGVRVSRSDDTSPRGLRALREDTLLGTWNPGSKDFTSWEGPGQSNALVFADGTHVLLERAENPSLNFLDIPHLRDLIWAGDDGKVVLSGVTKEPVLAPSRNAALAFAKGDWWLITTKGPKQLGLKGAANSHAQYRLPVPVARPVWVGNTALITLEGGIVGVSEDGTVRPLTPAMPDVSWELPTEAMKPGGPWPVLWRGEKEGGIGLASWDKPMRVVEKGPFRYDRAKALNDGVLYTRRNFETSPQIRLQRGTDEPTTIFTTNDQQADFAWGKAVPVRYSVGKTPSRGILVYPANFDPAQKYPMIMPLYEKFSQSKQLAYFWPDPTDAYAVQNFSQEGYFVLLPDMEYELGSPGDSAVKSIESALLAAQKLEKAIQPDRVGLMGHSWGAYQAIFGLIKSKLVRCAVAGAPIVDWASLARVDYEANGTPNEAILVESQGRLGADLNTAPQLYAKNSLLPLVKQLEKPLMVAFGSNDKLVPPWQQHLLYGEARAHEKSLILVEYPGEGHIFSQRSNQIDYANRVRAFLKTYLKGANLEPWMSGNQ